MNDQESFLEKASTLAFQKLEEVEGNIDMLEEPYKTIAVIYSAQGVIDNGGLVYFFESDWPHNPPYSMFADAYRRINLKEAGDAIEFAANSFGIPNPEKNKAFRNEFMDNETDGVEWNDCIGGADEVLTHLAEWLRMHYPKTFD
ncbi:MAG: hypothetical protein NXI32_30510 [bacterium]|nr:hypothetical protein [bacterium]